ncbi:hypothetical protein MBLNU230_g7187t1 [Neophaeotheca triangularis]
MPSASDLEQQQRQQAPESQSHSSYTKRSSTNNLNGRPSSELLSPSSDHPTPALDVIPGGWPQTPNGLSMASGKEGVAGSNGSIVTATNSVMSDGTSDRGPREKNTALSTRSRRSSNMDSERRSGETITATSPRPGAAGEGYFASIPNGKPPGGGTPKSPLAKSTAAVNGEGAQGAPPRTPHGGVSVAPGSTLSPVRETSGLQAWQSIQQTQDDMLKPPVSHAHHRASSPPAFSPSQTSLSPPSPNSAASPPLARPDRLTQRHTLEVPKVNTRTSGEHSADSAVLATGRFSPSTPTKRRGSLTLARRATRSIHSDMPTDEAPQDEDAARWTEHIKAKRASKKQRADTDDDRVVVGTKVDINHVNWVTAYDMLVGIRFCVSRINAKLDRELTDADFAASHKFSFDVTGNELTPSAKYDFKFKDYAPWVFRHLRAKFQLDPADYLVSLTSKYILSELGSPGKSGSFFYFSRDYKYIIKTIHHGEHKFLRKILKEYYNHVQENPNTLLSQFYGLHRVKIPYGRKIHFVVMNNLFPPHRDIHRTFDLKGSTIGRDFREEDLEKNPRATLKDLNWLRRNLHLEFGPTKKEAFVAQIQKDVALLQRLKIMDYSMLVGIHDLERGNEDNLRDKTLQVFQPGGDNGGDSSGGALMRTPSKMESQKRAQDLRARLKKEKPIPMAMTMDRMPEEAQKKAFYFYADDGGFRATHEDDCPGEEIYYLGIIDCLTRYNTLKKLEHFWKGWGPNEAQISPIPPERYGERFIRFISGVTKSRERAETERYSQTLDGQMGNEIAQSSEPTLNDPALGGMNIQRANLNPPGTEGVLERAERMAERSRREGHDEQNVPSRAITSVRSTGEGPDAVMLPVIGEDLENGSSTENKTPQRASFRQSREDVSHVPSMRGAAHNPQEHHASEPIIGNANVPSESLGEVPPPTPPKGEGASNGHAQGYKTDWRGLGGGAPPPTPPKDDRRGRWDDKELPTLPPVSSELSHSPTRAGDEELMRARRNKQEQTA